ncbi:MAG: AI-2E family transporter [Rikenellaceae bacterium]|nr:AI-2E family transporter [Rikenellaceae bacterium]MDE7356130.1 AI-2E family transporter [Rikenellaceae bacterium]
MNKLTRYIIALAVTAIVLFVVWYFRSIVKYILISAVLSVIGRPLMTLLERVTVRGRKFPHWAAATTTLCAIIGVTVLMMSLFMPLVLGKFHALTQYNYGDIVDIFSAYIASFESYMQERFAIDVNVIGDKPLRETIQEWLKNAVMPTVSGIGSLLGGVVDFLIGAFSVTFITFFFLKESSLFTDGVIILFPNRYDENVRRALDSSISLLSRYFIGLLVESAIKLVMVGVAIYLVTGLNAGDATIIALISAVLNVIPYIGPLLGAIIGILIAITTPEASGLTGEIAFQLTIIFAVFQLIDNIILQPYVYASSVKAHPLEIFLVILAAGSIAGVMGMLLAIPAYTVLRVFAKEFLSRLRVVQKLTENI